MWKPIAGYEGLYEVSDDGQVKTIPRRFISERTGRTVVVTGRIRKQHTNQKGYWRVILSKDGKPKSFSTHRLVATAFVDNPNQYPEINHNDGCKDNNNATNLEWCTHLVNIQHAIHNGLVRVLMGEESGSAKITNNDASEVVRLHSDGKRHKEIAEVVKCSEGTISGIINGRSWASVTGLKPKQSVVRRLGRDDLKQIINMKQSGAEVKQIAEAIGSSKGSIYNVLCGRSGSEITGVSRVEKRPRTIHADSTVHDVVELRKSGLKLYEIAEKTGVSESMITRILNGSSYGSVTGITQESCVLGHGRVTKEIALTIVKLRESGMSHKEIAKTTRCSARNIGEILRGSAWASVTGIQYASAVIDSSKIPSSM